MVRKGRNIGIFDTWEECERQTKGVASEFRSFPTLEEAKSYLTGHSALQLHGFPSPVEAGVFVHRR